MARKSTVRSVLGAVLIALNPFMSGSAFTAEVTASTAPVVTASEGDVRFIPLGIGKSVVVDLPRDAKDVLVANTQIANAVVRSTRRAYLIGLAVGQTNVYFFDAQGQQVAGFDIAVTRDLNGVRAALKQALPQSDVKIEGVGPDGVMLSGSVASPAEAQQAYDLASRLVGDKVANGLAIRGRDQVLLKVTVAEVQRDVIKQLGIDLSGGLNYGSAVVNFNNENPFSVTGSALSGSGIGAAAAANHGLAGSPPRVAATLCAMERAGVIRTLAEPNLTAISGESATFLAGGEFPVVGGYSCDPNTRICTQSVTYKKFGVSLSFTPVVLSEGRISLKVATEASELSSEGALSISSGIAGQAGAILPAVKTRRVDTTLEVPSGGSLAMAGMIQEQTKQQINGLPGLMQLPVLGALFKSREYVNRQSELMVIVTPYIVHAVARKELSRPDDGFADTSDPSAVLLGRLNRLYGVAGTGAPCPQPTNCDPRPGYRGNYGFILD